MGFNEDARRVSGSMLDPRVIDPRQELVRHDDLTEVDLERVVVLLTALRSWREAEQKLSFDSRSKMKLNDTDMKALRYIIASANADVAVTAGALSEHLHISTASTTKMLDRLERAGHIERRPHPTDRRAVTVAITEETHREVRRVMGAQHAHRFEVAKGLNSDEREIVIRFLTDLAAIPQLPEDPEDAEEPEAAETPAR